MPWQIEIDLFPSDSSVAQSRPMIRDLLSADADKRALMNIKKDFGTTTEMASLDRHETSSNNVHSNRY